ncbi:MAG: CoA transferase, partial [Deltaproteobacteria bacterium]|nr:CoA transferase [Deltaproteobacteria bacterium]
MLSGLKILDLTSNLPGPYATMLLADLGAEVLKIERPPLGDPARQTFAVEGSDSPHYQAVNRGKKSLTLNLGTQAGREIFFKLLAEYDIVIEGFRPGVMDRLGLGYQTLAARQPQLIYLALTGFGQNGPWRDKAGHDLTYLALAGVDGLNGLASGELSLPAIQVADLGGGSAMALFGLLAAVVNRQQTGQGRFIDVAMFDGVLSWLSFSGAGVIAGLEEDRPGGMWSTGRWPCYNLYPTADGRWMALGALEPHFWANFCRAVDREDLLDKAFAGPQVVQEMRRLFAGQSQAAWVELLQDA